MALPTTNLAGRYIAGTGITTGTGGVSTWADQSGNSNDLTQTSTSVRPGDVEDHLGYPAVWFESTDDMDIPSGVAWDTEELTIYVIGDVAMNAASVTLSGYGSGAVLRTSTSASNRTRIRCSSVIAEIEFTLLPALYGVIMDDDDTEILTMDDTHTGTGISADTGTAGNLDLNGYVYEVLIYNDAHDSTERDAVRQYVEDTYGIRGYGIDWTGQICFEGDSITAGTGLASGEDSYPRQVAIERRNWRAHSFAMSGNDIADLATRGAGVDDAIDGGVDSNILCVLIGRNDAAAGDSGATMYSALDTYVTARVAAGWEVWVCTCIATGNGTVQGRLDDLNALIRGDTGNGIIVDAGATKVIDLAALEEFDESSDSSNTTYYQGDNTHPTEAGAALIAAAIYAELEEESGGGGGSGTPELHGTLHRDRARVPRR